MYETLSPADVERIASASGLAMKELFVRAQISHTTFYRWKAGKTAPGLDVYERIRDVLRSVAKAA